MIVKDELAREGFGYAQLLVADYHLEYPLKKPTEVSGFCRVELIWQPSALEFLAEDLGRGGESDDYLKNVADELFPNLENRYNGFYEHGMNLWLLQGNLQSLYQVWEAHLKDCMIAPTGDDSTYDYWPNAMDMLLVMAQDLITLAINRDGAYYRDRIIEGLIAVIPAVVAVNGPLEDWEAEEYGKTIAAMTANKEETNGG